MVAVNFVYSWPVKLCIVFAMVKFCASMTKDYILLHMFKPSIFILWLVKAYWIAKENWTPRVCTYIWVNTHTHTSKLSVTEARGHCAWGWSSRGISARVKSSSAVIKQSKARSHDIMTSHIMLWGMPKSLNEQKRQQQYFLCV